MSGEKRERLNALAKKRGMSLNQFCLQAIERDIRVQEIVAEATEGSGGKSGA